LYDGWKTYLVGVSSSPSSSPLVLFSLFSCTDEVMLNDWDNSHRDLNPTLSWYDLQSLLKGVSLDILLMLDCCHAAGAVTKGISGSMEVLAGCSRESLAAGPGAGSIIGSPFTHTLTKHLREQASRPYGLLITELQTFLSLDEILREQPPIHIVLAGHYSPIKLQPLHSKVDDGGEDPMEGRETATVNSKLKALISVSFGGNKFPDLENFTQWLNTQRPNDVSKIEVQNLTIEAAFNNHSSSRVLFSVPIYIWARLHMTLPK
jgi:hypothetical protein